MSTTSTQCQGTLAMLHLSVLWGARDEDPDLQRANLLWKPQLPSGGDESVVGIDTREDPQPREGQKSSGEAWKRDQREHGGTSAAHTHSPQSKIKCFPKNPKWSLKNPRAPLIWYTRIHHDRGKMTRQKEKSYLTRCQSFFTLLRSHPPWPHCRSLPQKSNFKARTFSILVTLHHEWGAFWGNRATHLSHTTVKSQCLFRQIRQKDFFLNCKLPENMMKWSNMQSFWHVWLLSFFRKEALQMRLFLPKMSSSNLVRSGIHDKLCMPRTQGNQNDVNVQLLSLVFSSLSILAHTIHYSQLYSMCVKFCTLKCHNCCGQC